MTLIKSSSTMNKVKKILNNLQTFHVLYSKNFEKSSSWMNFFHPG